MATKWSRSEAALRRTPAWKRRAAAIAADVVRVLVKIDHPAVCVEGGREEVGGIVYTAACKALRSPAPPVRELSPGQKRRRAIQLQKRRP